MQPLPRSDLEPLRQGTQLKVTPDPRTAPCHTRPSQSQRPLPNACDHLWPLLPVLPGEASGELAARDFSPELPIAGAGCTVRSNLLTTWR